jgi:hypothetical protein
LDYVLREMTAPGGGFYSATDADSEGKEGAFFVWTPQQIHQTLAKQDAELAIKLYSVTNAGNFEGHNILHLRLGLEEFAEQAQMSLDDLRMRVDRINQKLREAREAREHPLRDDKIVTAWNGMMLTALAQAADLLQADEYQQAARRAGEFLWQHNRQDTGRLWRVHLAGQSSIAATQEDYAYLAEGLLHLYDLTQDAKWLGRAQELTEAMLARFLDPEGGFFMNEVEADITAMSRPKDDGSDNAIPSGTSVALRVLQMLWQRTGNMIYRDQANGLIGSFAASIERHPTGYAYMLSGIDDLRNGELSAHGYAAQGRIRVVGRLRSLADSKHLLNLAIQIPDGWHINANQPRSDDLIPTELQLGKPQSAWKLAPVTYPEAKLETLAFQNEPLAVYTGEIQLQALLESITATPDLFPLGFQLTLQACNDEVCLPPEQVELWIALAD